MTTNVIIIPMKQLTQATFEYVKLISQTFVDFDLNIDRTTSNLKQIERYSPGITISPRPTKLNFSSPSALMQGNSIFMGILRFFATVTITSVPYTQNMSQKKSAHKRTNPTLKLLRFIVLSATMTNSTPKMLFNSQCPVMKNVTMGMLQISRQHTEAGDTSKSLISNADLIHLCGWILTHIFLIFSEKLQQSSSMVVREITVAMQNWPLIIMLTISLSTNRNSRYIPSSAAEATMGNFIASFISITSSSSPFAFRANCRCPLGSTDRRVARMQPMNKEQQQLMMSWREIGST